MEKGVFIVGRKRTSTKRDLKLYVDDEIIEQLNFFKINKSVLFTDAAKAAIERMGKNEKFSKKD